MRKGQKAGAPTAGALVLLSMLVACASAPAGVVVDTATPGNEPRPEGAAPPAGPGTSAPSSLDADVVDSEGLPPAGHAFVIFGSDTVLAEVAVTFAERAEGLMNRTDLPPNGGMLFVFDQMEERTFWMKDTPLDLDLVLMGEGYRVFQIETMEANSLTLHDSEAPVFAALEVLGGWTSAHGVEVGGVAEVVFRD